MKRLRYSNISPAPYITPLLLPSTGYVEYTHSCFSLQEYHQRSVEWEQQRIQYQKQLTELEAQNKSLTDELTHMKVSAD